MEMHLSHMSTITLNEAAKPLFEFSCFFTIGSIFYTLIVKLLRVVYFLLGLLEIAERAILNQVERYKSLYGMGRRISCSIVRDDLKL